MILIVYLLGIRKQASGKNFILVTTVLPVTLNFIFLLLAMININILITSIFASHMDHICKGNSYAIAIRLFKPGLQIQSFFCRSGFNFPVDIAPDPEPII